MWFSKIKKFCFIFLLLMIFIFTVVYGDNIKLYLTNNISGVNEKKEEVKEVVDISGLAVGVTDKVIQADISKIAVEIERKEVYDGLTMDELVNKLNKYLKNKGRLANHGELIANQSLALGVDPYVAVAIMMHETGCNWKCSRLVENKNNVGGMKGRSGWQSFKTLEDGINGFLSNLSRNYYKKGLNTPEKMANKYAGGSTTWAGKIRNYMAVIEKV